MRIKRPIILPDSSLGERIRLPNNDFTIVDKEDYNRVNQYKWHIDGRGYAMAKINNKHVRLHKFILNSSSNQITDHINQNKLDNRKVNLRFCTGSQNRMNTPVRRDNQLGYKGVHLLKNQFRTKPYQALIKVNGKLKYLGMYKTAEEAALAWNQAAVKYQGEFACLNKVEL